MNEESQVSGCYNITFNYTNQETVSGNSVGSPLNQMHWCPGKAHINGDLLLQGHWGKEDTAGPARKV